MVKKLMFIGVLVIVISVLSLTKPAYAHFIIEDTHTSLKALFHVAPDDDPIAGQAGVISFDFSKTGVQTEDFSYVLTVKSTKGEPAAVPLAIAGNVVMANYTFPSQGFYNISLVATRKEDGTVSKLQYGQRISRGVVAEHSVGFGSVEIGAIAGVILFAVGAIIFSLKGDNSKQKEERK